MKEPTIDSSERFEAIRRAVEARDRFLAENIHLRPFQEEIDKRLKAAGSMENRMTILRCMMYDKLEGLRHACLQAKEVWERNYNERLK